MAKAPWKRDAVSGLPIKRLDGLDRPFLVSSGGINPSAFRGDDGVQCDVFNVKSMAALAGYTPVYFENVVLRDPLFHTVPIKTLTGKTIGYATRAESAMIGGEMIRARTAGDDKV